MGRSAYRDVLASQLETEFRAQGKSVTGRRLERLESTVAQQQEQIVALKKAVKVAQTATIDAMIEAFGSALPQWAERERFVRFGSVWRADKSYSPNTLCTHSGSGFVSTRETTAERPGSGPDGGWVLAIKSVQPRKAEPKDDH